ncbi:MAG: thermonuclease family protein [Saprospiraceae bacterium]|jgi:micrococcal nuclease
MKYLNLRALGLFALFTFSFAPKEASFLLPPETIILQGKVIGIMDGDTFDLLRGTEKLRVRLEGIDCPEKGQPFGNNAKQALSSLCFGQQVRVEFKSKDRYGRALARAYLSDGRCINEEMLRIGMAWHFKRYSDDARWARMEDVARRSKVGLWADARPVAPWDWRSQRRQRSNS